MLHTQESIECRAKVRLLVELLQRPGHYAREARANHELQARRTPVRNKISEPSLAPVLCEESSQKTGQKRPSKSRGSQPGAQDQQIGYLQNNKRLESGRASIFQKFEQYATV